MGKTSNIDLYGIYSASDCNKASWSRDPLNCNKPTQLMQLDWSVSITDKTIFVVLHKCR